MKFSDTPGHDDIKDILRKMADSDRIHHSIMLSGKPGIGKMNVARAFAQYVHCSNRRGGEPCGVCPSCLQHAQLNHPDLHFVYPVIKVKKEKLFISDDYAAQWKEMLGQFPFMPYNQWLDILNAGQSRPAIYVDESVDIVKKASYSAFRERYKIFIIWLPEKMNADAANKLLKIIEEPFGDTIFLLVSDRPDEVLPTISSRSMPLRMLPLDTSEIALFIEERHGVDHEEALALAARAEGSAGEALLLAAHPDEQNEFRDTFQNMMRYAYGRQVAALKAMGDDMAGWGREKLCRYMDYCCGMMRQNFFFNLHDRQLFVMSDKEEMFSRRFAPFIHHGNIEGLTAAFESAKKDVSRNANAKVVMFSTMLRLIPLIRMARP